MTMEKALFRMRRTLPVSVGLLALLTAVPACAEPSVLEQGPAPILVTTTDGSVLSFTRVEPWPGGFVRAIPASGDAVFIPDVKIHRILDSDGEDVTNRVIVRRKSVQEAPKQILALPKTPRSPKLRGRPSPEQQAFTLVQAGFVRRLGPTVGYEPRSVFVADLGRMWNHSSRHSLGASIFVATNETFTRVGVKPRYRRWINRITSIDVAPGVFFSVPGDGEPEFAPVGFVGESALNVGDWVSITGMVNVVGVKHRDYHYGPGPAPSPPVAPVFTESSGTEATAYLGFKVGGEAAIGGAIGYLVLVGLAILLLPAQS